MRNKYLCKMTVNLADEINLTYLQIYSETDMNILKDRIKDNYDKTILLHYGNNHKDELTGADIEDCIEWSLIPDTKTEKFIRDSILDDEFQVDDLLEPLFDNDDYENDNYEEDDYSDENDEYKD